jgi:HK97 gp10 family phage protein
MITATLEGLGQLLGTFTTAGKVVRAAVGQKSSALADELVEDMKARAPEDSGTLRESIRAEPNDEDGTVTVRAGGTPETARPTAGGETYDEALLTEYGTIHQAPRPFFEPSVEARRAEIGDALVRAGNDAVGDL